MSQNNSNEKTASMTVIEKINEVSGFDPTPFAVEYTDLNTGEVRKRLPVMIQMAWFRLKYPEGKIALQVTSSKDCFIATARVYPNYKDPVECYLAEATASRSYQPDKPSVSPREWAQTAAVGIALRNAGFGLQFSAAGEDFGDIAPDELGGDKNEADTETMEVASEAKEEPKTSDESQNDNGYAVEPTKELTQEEKLQQAMEMPCPITKFKGKTLSDVLTMDPGALKWLATKFKGDDKIKEAAEMICEYAVTQASA